MENINLLKGFFRAIVIRWPHEFWLRLNKRISLLIDRWRVKQVIKEANLLNSIDGKRYFVLRDGHRYPIAVNRNTVVDLKKRGIMSKEVNVFHLYKECLYYTGQPKKFKEFKTGEIK